MRKKVPGHIRNVTFRNITVEGEDGRYLIQVSGADQEHMVNDVTFDNLTIQGESLTAESAHLKSGEHVEGLSFDSD
jgi:hypothetical protein